MKEKNKISVILGAFIGALIGTIPLSIVYSFGNILIAIMSLPIAVFSYYGYKIMKGKLNKKTSITIIISCILSITISTFLIIPAINLLARGYKASFQNLSMFYGINEIKEEFIKDYIISLFCGLLGSSGVIFYINKQLKESNNFKEEMKSNSIEEGSIEEKNKQNDNIEKNIENSPNSIEKYKNKAIIIIVLLIVFSILIVIGNSIAGKNNKQPNEQNNEKEGQKVLEEIQVEVNEIEHKIPETNLKFIPKDDLKILTKKQIEKYFGANASNYELIAMDDAGTKMLYMFIDNKEDVKDLNATEYLRHTFSDDESVEITEIPIAGTTFEKARSQTR